MDQEFLEKVNLKTQNFTHIIRIWGNSILTKISNFLNKTKFN